MFKDRHLHKYLGIMLIERYTVIAFSSFFTVRKIIQYSLIKINSCSTYLYYSAYNNYRWAYFSDSYSEFDKQIKARYYKYRKIKRYKKHL